MKGVRGAVYCDALRCAAMRWRLLYGVPQTRGVQELVAASVQLVTVSRQISAVDGLASQ